MQAHGEAQEVRMMGRTYGEVLKGHPFASRIMEILDVKPSDKLPERKFVPDVVDRKFTRPVTLVEAFARSERGIVTFWWNYFE